jgi:hypothetical protein
VKILKSPPQLWLGLAEARRVATASGTDLLRVMISKSLNFIFSVTVRLRVPLTESFATASRKNTQLRRHRGLDTRAAWRAHPART